MFGDDHIGRLLLLVDVNLFDLGRPERLCDELGDVVSPLNHIDFLTT